MSASAAMGLPPGTMPSSKISERISVHVRLRPLNKERCDPAWKARGNSLTLGPEKMRTSSQEFSFDHVFNDSKSNEEVYDGSLRGIVHSVFDGFNGTLFAYGQTGSGKTHTMLGTEGDPGLIPQAVWDLFGMIDTSERRQFLLRVSYMELYNDRIIDLFAPENGSLKIKGTVNGLVQVEGLKEKLVKSPEDVMGLLEVGQQHRHVAGTKMNEQSSRSHTMFRLILESREFLAPSSPAGAASPSAPEVGAVRMSTLTLVDLAGSERVDKTGATGDRLREGASTNKSLVVLGQVIRMLSEGADKLGQHIPFRDSKLTHILQPSLGGNARTAVVCAVSLSARHTEESLGTLYFGNAAKTVVNQATVNETVSERALLQRQAHEIEALQGQLSQQEGLAEQYRSRLHALQECWLTGTPGATHPSSTGGGLRPKVRARTRAAASEGGGGRRGTWGGADCTQAQGLHDFRARVLGRAGSLSLEAGGGGDGPGADEALAGLRARVAELEAEREALDLQMSKLGAEKVAALNDKRLVLEESQKQLDRAARENRALLEEGARQVDHGAARQAELTTEIARLKRQARQLEQEKAARDAESEALVRRVEGMEMEARGLCEEQARRRQDVLSQLQDAEAARDAAAAQFASERADLATARDEAAAQLASERAERVKAEARAEKLGTEAAERAAAAEASAAEAATARDAAAKRVAAAEAARDAAAAARAEAEVARAEAARARDAAAERAAEAEAASLGLSREREVADIHIGILEAQLDTLKQARAAAAAEAAALAGRLADAEASRLAAELESKTAGVNKDASGAALGRAEERMQELVGRNERLSLECDMARSAEVEAAGRARALADENEGLRVELEAAQLQLARRAEEARVGTEAMDQAQGAQRETDAHMSAVEGQVAELVGQRDAAEARAAGAEHALAAAEARASAAAARIRELEEDTELFESRVEALESAAPPGGLEAQVAGLREKHAEQLAALRGDAAAAESARHAAAAHSEAVAADAAALRSELASVRAEAEKLARGHSEIQGELGALRARHVALGEELDAIRARHVKGGKTAGAVRGVEEGAKVAELLKQNGDLIQANRGLLEGKLSAPWGEEASKLLSELEAAWGEGGAARTGLGGKRVGAMDPELMAMVAEAC